MYQRILVPIDGSPTSERGLVEAIALARLTGGTLCLVHVLDELIFTTGFETGAIYMTDILPALRQRGAQILETAKGRVAAAGVAVETVSAESFARRTSDVIVEQATEWRADLIVLGTHGRRGINRALLGSDAEQVLRMAPMPVLLVRSPDVAARVEAASAQAAMSTIARVSTASL